MAPRHGVAGIGGTIAPQIVVTRDLVGRQQGRRLDVAREVDEPQFGPGGGRCVDQGAQGVRRHAAIPEGRLNCRFGRNEALARLLRLGLHGGENVLDGRDLTGVQIQLGFQLEQMRRPGHAVQFGGKGQSPSAPEAQIFQINLRQALDLAAFQPGIGGMAVGLSEKVHGKGHGAKGESKAEHQETPEVFLLLSHLVAAPHMIMIMSEVFEDLFADAMERDFAAGETLFRAGDKVVSMMLLRDGRADLVRHTGHGLRLILHRAEAGQILAEASAWSKVYHCDAVASAACVAAVLPRQFFRARLKADPDLAERWMQTLARSVQAARVRAEIRSLPKVADRLDAWLCDGHALPDKGRWQDVASELGVSREALYRELARRQIKARS